jgi:hypothetical protein
MRAACISELEEATFGSPRWVGSPGWSPQGGLKRARARAVRGGGAALLACMRCCHMGPPSPSRRLERQLNTTPEQRWQYFPRVAIAEACWCPHSRHPPRAGQGCGSSPLLCWRQHHWGSHRGGCAVEQWRRGGAAEEPGGQAGSCGQRRRRHHPRGLLRRQPAPAVRWVLGAARLPCSQAVWIEKVLCWLLLPASLHAAKHTLIHLCGHVSPH